MVCCAVPASKSLADMPTSCVTTSLRCLWHLVLRSGLGGSCTDFGEVSRSGCCCEFLPLFCAKCPPHPPFSFFFFPFCFGCLILPMKTHNANLFPPFFIAYPPWSSYTSIIPTGKSPSKTPNTGMQTPRLFLPSLSFFFCFFPSLGPFHSSLVHQRSFICRNIFAF